MTDIGVDSIYLHPGRVISEYLDPGLFELYHHPASGRSVPAPFLDAAPLNMAIEPVNTPEFSVQWVFWFILLGFAILTIVRYYYEKRLKLIFSSVIKRSASQQLLRESPVHAHQSFIPLLAIYFISVVILAHQMVGTFSPGATTGIHALKSYAQILGLYVSFFIFKIITIWLISITFKNIETGLEYIQNIIIFNLALGIFLLPLLLLITFISPVIFIYVAVGLALLIMALRFFRGISIGLSDTKFSLFHLFLYLCTLEILPVIIMVKFFSKYFVS